MRHRVFTYITRSGELLVFDHVAKRYLDPQIPGGTIEQGESPETAALREGQEETGLAQLQVVRFLGDIEIPKTADTYEDIHAWYYHLGTTESTQQRWRHFEMDPSNGSEPVRV